MRATSSHQSRKKTRLRSNINTDLMKTWAVISLGLQTATGVAPTDTEPPAVRGYENDTNAVFTHDLQCWTFSTNSSDPETQKCKLNAPLLISSLAAVEQLRWCLIALLWTDVRIEQWIIPHTLWFCHEEVTVMVFTVTCLPHKHLHKCGFKNSGIFKYKEVKSYYSCKDKVKHIWTTLRLVVRRETTAAEPLVVGEQHAVLMQLSNVHKWNNKSHQQSKMSKTESSRAESQLCCTWSVMIKAVLL